MRDEHEPSRSEIAAVAFVSGALLLTELALTRIFSVVMYYHFAFLAISIALFGLSASGVFAYVRRVQIEARPMHALLARQSTVYAVATVISLFVLVRLRVGLNYSPRNLALMLLIYLLAAAPFFTGGLVVTLAISHMARRIDAVYAADLLGAASGCLLLIPLLDWVGAPGVVLTAAALGVAASLLFAPREIRSRIAAAGAAALIVPLVGQLSGVAGFDVVDTKGHAGDRVLFTKWNSFSRVGVYERAHGDWSLSSAYHGPLPPTRFMDIDSAASTPIIEADASLDNVQYLRYELTALAYRLAAGGRDFGLGSWEDRSEGIDASNAESQSNPRPPTTDTGFTALVVGPGGGRDLLSALVFGARHVDGVEINPIIANDVMRGQFRQFSGDIYDRPRVHVVVDDGRSFVRRSTERYDVIQLSLVDTWAATAAGAYTLTENTLYTVEAFHDYLDHLSPDGMLSITRWVFDGVRLVSLAQVACAARGQNAADRVAVVEDRRVATFLLKNSPFTAIEARELHNAADELGFKVLYVPGDRPADNDYSRLIRTTDREAFYRSYPRDIRPTTDDRPFFFHTTKLADQFAVAFGRSMLFGNGLSALVTLMGISAVLVTLFVLGPLAIAGPPPPGWLPWLVYFGALGAGFMLIEVSVLQRFVLLLGHPVYSLTVTLFSLLVGTGLGAKWTRRLEDKALGRAATVALIVIALLALTMVAVVTPIVAWAIPLGRPIRILVALALLVPMGAVLGVPMPAGIRLVVLRAPQLVTWGWGINGALSVVGATCAIFIAMNWGFGATLAAAAAVYLTGLFALPFASRSGTPAT